MCAAYQVSHTMMLNYMSVDVKSGLLQPCASPLFSFLFLPFYPHLSCLFSLAHLSLLFTELFHRYYHASLSLCEHDIVSVTQPAGWLMLLLLRAVDQPIRYPPRNPYGEDFFQIARPLENAALNIYIYNSIYVTAWGSGCLCSRAVNS